MATDLYQGWDHRWLGSAIIDWEDDAGSHQVEINASSDVTRFCHLSLASVDPMDRSGTTIDLGFVSFAAILQSLMNAETTETVTVTFSTTTLAYTIACTGAVFELTLNALARRILGFTLTTTYSGATSYTSTMRPFYVWRAAIDGTSSYDQPVAIADVVKSRRADDGTFYTASPARIVREASWEFRHEAQAAVHRRFAVADTTIGGASWTFEDFAEHAARYAVPCVKRDSQESVVFFMPRGFVRGALDIPGKTLLSRQTVRVRADSVVGYL
jgi:hypothetical protein